jgi:hypothetical protein
MQVSKGTLLDGVTETTVSSGFGVRYAERITLAFTRSGHVSGSAIFTVQASIDGKAGGSFISNVNLIPNDPNNHTQTVERQITVELGANDTQFYALDLENFCYDYIQVKVVESGTGESTCKILAVNC